MAPTPAAVRTTLGDFEGCATSIRRQRSPAWAWPALCWLSPAGTAVDEAAALRGGFWPVYTRGEVSKDQPRGPATSCRSAEPIRSSRWHACLPVARRRAVLQCAVRRGPAASPTAAPPAAAAPAPARPPCRSWPRPIACVSAGHATFTRVSETQSPSTPRGRSTKCGLQRPPTASALKSIQDAVAQCRSTTAPSVGRATTP